MSPPAAIIAFEIIIADTTRAIEIIIVAMIGLYSLNDITSFSDLLCGIVRQLFIAKQN